MANLPAPLLDGSHHDFVLEQALFNRHYDPIYDGERALRGFYLPPFQRPEVWTPFQKARFVESLFLGTYAGVYVVTEWDWRAKGDRKPQSGWLIDGQQRLTALDDFVEGRIAVFDGVRFADLDPRQNRRFLTTPFPCITIPGNVPLESLRTLYDRLNYGGTPHTPVEPNSTV